MPFFDRLSLTVRPIYPYLSEGSDSKILPQNKLPDLYRSLLHGSIFHLLELTTRDEMVGTAVAVSVGVSVSACVCVSVILLLCAFVEPVNNIYAHVRCM